MYKVEEGTKHGFISGNFCSLCLFVYTIFQTIFFVQTEIWSTNLVQNINDLHVSLVMVKISTYYLSFLCIINNHHKKRKKLKFVMGKKPKPPPLDTKASISNGPTHLVLLGKNIDIKRSLYIVTMTWAWHKTQHYHYLLVA